MSVVEDYGTRPGEGGGVCSGGTVKGRQRPFLEIHGGLQTGLRVLADLPDLAKVKEGRASCVQQGALDFVFPASAPCW